MTFSIDDTITLIKRTPTGFDSYGQETFTETTRAVFAKVTSASRGEFYQARQTGLEAEFVFTTDPVNYEGETVVEYNKERYSIYRTYRRGLDSLELYAQRQVGAL